MTPELLEALRALLKENPGDWIYEVRDRATTSGDGFEGNAP